MRPEDIPTELVERVYIDRFVSEFQLGNIRAEIATIANALEKDLSAKVHKAAYNNILDYVKSVREHKDKVYRGLPEHGAICEVLDKIIDGLKKGLEPSK